MQLINFTSTFCSDRDLKRSHHWTNAFWTLIYFKGAYTQTNIVQIAGVRYGAIVYQQIALSWLFLSVSLSHHIDLLLFLTFLFFTPSIRLVEVLWTGSNRMVLLHAGSASCWVSTNGNSEVHSPVTTGVKDKPWNSKSSNHVLNLLVFIDHWGFLEPSVYT